MHYVYVLQGEESHQLYVGFTSDLKRRFEEHTKGQSKFTSRDKWRLVYYEAYASETDARRREQRLKHHGQAMRQLKLRIVCSMEECG